MLVIRHIPFQDSAVHRNQEEIRRVVQEAIQEDITAFTFIGAGAVNNAYSIHTVNGRKYIVKQEREDKELQPQNDVVVEANVIQQLHALGLSIPVPNVVCISEPLKMYGYEYIEGATLKESWGQLSEMERVRICEALGRFHAEIGKKYTKEMTEAVGVKIDLSSDVHPEIAAEYSSVLADADAPEEWKNVAREARRIFDTTTGKAVFQFLHNDAHHENVLIKDKKISGIIDFGNAEYGDVTKEFSRYIRDFPDHFEHIVSAYEAWSGNDLSRGHLVSNALLSGLMEIVEEYRKGGGERAKAQHSIAVYKQLLAF